MMAKIWLRFYGSFKISWFFVVIIWPFLMQILKQPPKSETMAKKSIFLGANTLFFGWLLYKPSSLGENLCAKWDRLVLGVVPPRYKKYGMDFFLFQNIDINYKNMETLKDYLNNFVQVLGIIGPLLTICVCSSLRTCMQKQYRIWYTYVWTQN